MILVCLQGSNLVPYLKINEQFKFKIKAAKKELSQMEIDELVAAFVYRSYFKISILIKYLEEKDSVQQLP